MMQRFLTLLAAVAALLLGLPGLGQAAGTVVNRSGLPAGLTPIVFACSVGNSGDGSVTHVAGPGTPPLGSGSLKLDAGPDTFTSLGTDLTTTDSNGDPVGRPMSYLSG